MQIKLANVSSLALWVRVRLKVEDIMENIGDPWTGLHLGVKCGSYKCRSERFRSILLPKRGLQIEPQSYCEQCTRFHAFPPPRTHYYNIEMRSRIITYMKGL